MDQHLRGREWGFCADIYLRLFCSHKIPESLLIFLHTAAQFPFSYRWCSAWESRSKWWQSPAQELPGSSGFCSSPNQNSSPVNPSECQVLSIQRKKESDPCFMLKTRKKGSVQLLLMPLGSRGDYFYFFLNSQSLQSVFGHVQKW